MTEEQLLQRINFYSKKLGVISNLAFIKTMEARVKGAGSNIRNESLEDILAELERLDKICIGYE